MKSSNEEAHSSNEPSMTTQLRHVPTRFRARTALTGGRTPGTKLFNSAEHWSVVDGMHLRMADGSMHEAAHFLFKLRNGCMLSFGQIIALAGDFYAIWQAPISDQPDKLEAFRKTFATLDTAIKAEVEKILSIMEEEFQAIAEAIAAGEDPHTAYDQRHREWDAKYNHATGGSDSAYFFLRIGDWGRYMWIASYNWDHFGLHAHEVYQAGLTVAMETAAEAGQKNGEDRQNDLLMAYQQLAFACHYLTDSFSAGHLRTPRRHLHDFSLTHTSATHFASDSCAEAMHNEDNFNGLWVRNAAGDEWIAYGDGRYFDEVNRANRNVMRAAVRCAIDDVYQSFVAGKPVASPTSLPLMPALPLSPTNTENFAALFYTLDTNAMAWVRLDLTDPRRYQWGPLRPLPPPVSSPWLLLALGLQSSDKPPHIGAPPRSGSASGPHVNDRGEVSEWMEQGHLWQGHSRPLTTNAPPAVAEFDGHLWVCVRQGSGLLFGSHTSAGWTDFAPLKISGDPVQTLAGPSLVVHKGGLHCFYPDVNGCLQWLQWTGTQWRSNGSVLVDGYPAQSDAAPAALSVPKSETLVLVYKGLGSSYLFKSWYFEEESKWVGNSWIKVADQPMPAMSDAQPVAATGRDSVFVYYRGHATQTLFRLDVQYYPYGKFDFAGNVPVSLPDGTPVTTSMAVAASTGVDASTALLIVPRDEKGSLHEVSQLRVGSTEQFQYMESDLQLSDGRRLRSSITPALARIGETFWLLTVNDKKEVVLSFGQP